MNNSQINLPLLKKGKVRDVYDAGKMLLIVASDRVSVFDCVLPSQIPDKGKILTQISNFWFAKTISIVPNHMISSDINEINIILKLGLDPQYYSGRTVLVKKCERIDFECVVRGYITGSAWKEYQKSGTVCGEKIKEGLKEAQKFPEPIFTPASKADTGHDENVSFAYMLSHMDKNLAYKIKDTSIKLYNFAEEYLKNCGIILADTKFEFGLIDGDLILIDEILTPDSSRFWDAALYKTGTNPPGFDKQFVRDYMEQTGWDKNPPPPAMPQSIALAAAKKYKEALSRIEKGSV
ncbi:Phosphoribosylaminoimidazole-succinocarboxamide synthase [Elusimicrobium minutum Pei191]|uniref:Phosphoribosylaminoimidazole-succinocarboxamide synthase n=1 Tax=Elusimicrobium minutum (strain Pei191) TaxID=445932 RepID=PUR7_ELUMP|nr:phosphoribosylaminoimidazolesuccinocarboxamide synthase [Elusimicrobium minutum]B2KCE9.1 RecName: Full=Phosphoribosylaminoimidazole-succinocarboxamide synthase; AltName: Full=SAICAR synthetase [Elusimicrobium minutum Pei191]ACC98070.1 Phosphoribosylaminoimidazole-succinocarboxamide synthase [Elusimicrobium minutum Pei191]